MCRIASVYLHDAARYTFFGFGCSAKKAVRGGHACSQEQWESRGSKCRAVVCYVSGSIVVVGDWRSLISRPFFAPDLCPAQIEWLSFCPPAIYSFHMRSILPAENNPALRSASRELSAAEIQSVRIKKLIGEMKRLLARERYGVALAAAQVGEPLRFFIVSGRALARDARNTSDEPEKKDERPTLSDQIFINPKMLKMSRGKKEKHEGCLSIRGKWGEVPRAEKVTLRYLDESGTACTRGASGFLAHIFQHEMDHLEGILYTDKATHLYDEQLEK